MISKAKSYFHHGGETPLTGSTIPGHFLSIVNQFPDREAVVSLTQSQRLTYREFSRQIDQLARGLMALGFKQGDRIGVWSTNNIEWLLIQMASARMGAILVNINPAYRSRELTHALQQSELQCLFVIPRFRNSDYLAMLQDLIPELQQNNPEITSATFPFLSRVIVVDPKDSPHTQLPTAGFSSWQQVISGAGMVSQAELEKQTERLDRDDVINIQYTSGTTGRLKEMIIRGGENIYPREIEDFIFTHPKVAEVAVFGVADERYGEQVAAWIQLHGNETATEEEIRVFCKDNIAHFKIPKYIRFVTEFPLTVSGKPQKFKMRETMAEIPEAG
jgi:acyl-CoA synthetase (AMP-forming)/AMP-acid ligase II